MKRKKQKNKKKIKEVTLSDIVENEIKFNGLRQGFSKALNKLSKNLKYKNSIQHSDLMFDFDSILCSYIQYLKIQYL